MSGSFSWEEAVGGGPAAPAPAAAGEFSWDEAQMPATPPAEAPAPKKSGLVANIGAGTSNALAGTLGAPVDLVTGGINLAARGVNAATGAHIPEIKNPVGGSDFFRSTFGMVGADPRNIVPASETEQIGRAAGEGVASMILPWSIARSIPVMGGMAGAAQRMFGAGSAGGQAAIGAAAGAGGQIAENAAPEPFKPLANFAGQIAGGGAAGLSVAAGRALIDQGANLAKNAAAPFTTAGRERLAGQKIAKAATDLPAVRESLDNPPAPLVPGSEPTTFQATGDQGLGQLERAIGGGSGGNHPAFVARAGEQNAARVAALETLAPADASPEAVGQAFRRQLAALDAEHEAAIGTAREKAQQAVGQLGGTVPVGADQQTSALQAFGMRIRGGLAAANEQARAAVSRLYDKVDPDGTLAVDTAPIRQAAKNIVADIPKNARPPEGEASRILSVAQLQPAVQRFNEVSALRSRITDAMRTELFDNGRSQTYRRLTQLLASIDDVLQNGVQKRAAEDAAALAGGTLSPEQTMLARLKELAERGRAAEQSADMGARVVGGPGAGGGARGSAPSQAGIYGAGGSAGGRFGGAPRNQSLPGQAQPLIPNFDAEAAARYRAANAAHAQRVATFDAAPGVGPVLATGARAGEWRLGDSQVAATIFNGGKGAAERIQAFLRAGGDNADLVQDIQDYAAFSLRRAAEAPDGTLDPKKFGRWMEAHRESLSPFPELAQRFRDAASARQVLDEATARHVAAREAYETSAAARFLGDADPVIAVGRILRSDHALATMKELAQLTANDPAARAGLKRAVVEFIRRDLQGNTEAGGTGTTLLKSDAFQTFVKKTPAALAQIFSPEEVQSIKNIAADLQRANKSIAGTKLPGGSNTAQDLAAGEKHGHGNPSVLTQVIMAEAAGEMAHHAAGPIGKAIGLVVTPALAALRQAGLAKVDALVTEAMLNPALARTLLMKVPADHPVVVNALRHQLAAMAAQAAVTSGRDTPRPKTAADQGLAAPSSVPRVSAGVR